MQILWISLKNSDRKYSICCVVFLENHYFSLVNFTQYKTTQIIQNKECDMNGNERGMKWIIYKGKKTIECWRG